MQEIKGLNLICAANLFPELILSMLLSKLALFLNCHLLISTLIFSTFFPYRSSEENCEGLFMLLKQKKIQLYFGIIILQLPLGNFKILKLYSLLFSHILAFFYFISFIVIPSLFIIFPIICKP